MFVGAQQWANDAVAGAAVDIKANGAALLHGLRLVNTTAAAAYLQVFSAPHGQVVLGTTAPAFFVRLGANESLTMMLNMPLAVGGSGLSVAGTTAPGGNTGAAISVTAFFE